MLRWMHDDGIADRRQIQRQEVLDTRSVIDKALPLATDQHLDALFSRPALKGDMGNRWIHGRKTYGDSPVVLPVVTAQWDFTGGPGQLQLLVVLVVARLSSATATSPHPKTMYRFEHGVPNTVHDYHHAQPTLSATRNGGPLPGVFAPLNITSPAFPLDATGPAGIVMCLMRALYGAKNFKHAFAAQQGLRQVASPYMHQMPAFQAASRTSASVTR